MTEILALQAIEEENVESELDLAAPFSSVSSGC